MIEKGQGDKYRGKSIDEININVNDLISDESGDDEINEPLNQATASTERSSTSTSYVSKSPIISPSTKSFTTNDIDKTKLKIKQKIIIIPWNDDEKSITTKYFKKYILLGKAPRKSECEEFLKIHPNINRTWKKVKDFVHNSGNAKKNIYSNILYFIQLF